MLLQDISIAPEIILESKSEIIIIIIIIRWIIYSSLLYYLS